MIVGRKFDPLLLFRLRIAITRGIPKVAPLKLSFCCRKLDVLETTFLHLATRGSQGDLIGLYGRLCVSTFKKTISETSRRIQILYGASLGWRKGFWARSDQNSDFHGNIYFP